MFSLQSRSQPSVRTCISPRAHATQLTRATIFYSRVLIPDHQEYIDISRTQFLYNTIVRGVSREGPHIARAVQYVCIPFRACGTATPARSRVEAMPNPAPKKDCVQPLTMPMKSNYVLTNRYTHRYCSGRLGFVRRVLGSASGLGNWMGLGQRGASDPAGMRIEDDWMPKTRWHHQGY
eukprot:7799335-Pyramimonas_sp.AAC.2